MTDFYIDSPWDCVVLAQCMRSDIERLAAASERLLKRPNLEDYALEGLRVLHFALSRLPLQTEGVDLELEIYRLKPVKIDPDGYRLHHGIYLALDDGIGCELLLGDFISFRNRRDTLERVDVWCSFAGGFELDIEPDESFDPDWDVDISHWVDTYETACADPNWRLVICDGTDDRFHWDQSIDPAAWTRMPPDFSHAQ